MKIVLTTGGTAGHINPALALAEELEKRGDDVIFAGTPNRLESKLVPQAGYDFVSFSAKGFNRRKPHTLIVSVFSILKSTKAAKKWLKEVGADAVIGFGCYVSLSICRAAKQLNIPYYIHEQNSVMGMANKYLCKRASATCLTYKRAASDKCNNVFVTGNPVRSSVINAKASDGRKMLGVPDDAKMLLVFGGSLGAKMLNSEICKMANDLLERKDLYIVHITGNKLYESVADSLKLDKDKQDRYKVLAYQNKMGETLAAADMCISRAGASTIAELTAISLPSLLVPYPYATENHQFYNAQALLDAGCVLFVEDDKVGTKEFRQAVETLVDDKDKRSAMKKAYEQFDAKNSVKLLADIVQGKKQ